MLSVWYRHNHCRASQALAGVIEFGVSDKVPEDWSEKNCIHVQNIIACHGGIMRRSCSLQAAYCGPQYHKSEKRVRDTKLASFHMGETCFCMGLWMVHGPRGCIKGLSFAIRSIRIQCDPRIRGRPGFLDLQNPEIRISGFRSIPVRVKLQQPTRESGFAEPGNPDFRVPENNSKLDFRGCGTRESGFPGSGGGWLVFLNPSVPSV